MPKDLEPLNAEFRAAVEDTSEWQMSGYYYTFDPTGDARIDRILSAVAVAGMGFHNTEDWNEKAGAGPRLRGETPVEWIQNAANDAAANCTPLPAVAVTEDDIKRVVFGLIHTRWKRHLCTPEFLTAEAEQETRICDALRRAQVSP